MPKFIIPKNNFYNLEKEWLRSKSYFSLKKWLEIFPEAQTYLELKLKKYHSKAKKLAEEVEKDLIKIYGKKTDKFTEWFLVEILRIWKGDKLDKMIREINKISFALSPPKTNGRLVSEVEIETARNYPLDQLLKTKNDFALCPNHSEKHPSFYVKNGFGYCFSCGYTCDSIKFVMDKNEINFIEAVKQLS